MLNVECIVLQLINLQSRMSVIHIRVFFTDGSKILGSLRSLPFFHLILLFYYDLQVAGVCHCAALGHVFFDVSLNLFMRQAEVHQVVQGLLPDDHVIIHHVLGQCRGLGELATLRRRPLSTGAATTSRLGVTALADDDAAALLLAGVASAGRVTAGSVISDLRNVVDDVDVVVDCVAVGAGVLARRAARVVGGPAVPTRRTNVPLRSVACRWLAARIWAEEGFRRVLVWLSGSSCSWIPRARCRLLEVIAATAIRVGLPT